jgi:hypothetical protein
MKTSILTQILNELAAADSKLKFSLKVGKSTPSFWHVAGVVDGDGERHSVSVYTQSTKNLDIGTSFDGPGKVQAALQQLIHKQAPASGNRD